MEAAVAVATARVATTAAHCVTPNDSPCAKSRAVPPTPPTRGASDSLTCPSNKAASRGVIAKITSSNPGEIRLAAQNVKTTGSASIAAPRTAAASNVARSGNGIRRIAATSARTTAAIAYLIAKARSGGASMACLAIHSDPQINPMSANAASCRGLITKLSNLIAKSEGPRFHAALVLHSTSVELPRSAIARSRSTRPASATASAAAAATATLACRSRA
jgi:hypothetical protein